MPPTEKSRDSRSSVECKTIESIRFRTNNNGNKKTHNNQQNRGRSPDQRKPTKVTVKKSPVTTVNAIATTLAIARHASSAADLGISKMNAGALKTTI